MNFVRRISIAILLLTSASAFADTKFDFVFKGNNGILTEGQFTAVSTAPGSNVFEITDINGIVLTSPGHKENIIAEDPVNTDGSDNLLLVTFLKDPFGNDIRTAGGTFALASPFLTFGGVSFSTDQGGDYNLFLNTDGSYGLNIASGPLFNQTISESNLTVSQVPEPSSIILLGSGLLGLGGAFKRRRLA